MRRRIEDFGTVKRAFGDVRLGGLARYDDHAVWRYASDRERATVAADWIRAGLRAGCRCLYVADGSVTDLQDEMSCLDDAIEAGRLIVAPLAELYELDAPIDPTQQLAVYDRALDDAIAEGFRGLRAAVDITPLVADPERRAAHLEWEQFADRHMTRRRLAALCMYDGRRVDHIDAIACAHPLQGPGGTGLAVYGEAPERAVVAGELDSFRSETFRQVLRALPSGDRVVDVSRISFIDARSAWALCDEVLRHRSQGRELVLDGATPVVQRVWDVLELSPEVWRRA